LPTFVVSTMKALLTYIFLVGLMAHSGAQTLTGTWQVVKETDCLGIDLGEFSDTEEELLEEMSSLSGEKPKTIRFDGNGAGEENWRTRGKRRPSSKEKFLYRYNDGTLYFLDKRSRLITGTFIIEEHTATSLILFNKDRNCERAELVRVN
jgi:hypothetical protein